ncbi:MAG TPA: NeuD/PglB/VioB family sugar acetyltransferase [Arachnia sp.]|nr:NeuD/PglB/VioB family sugar acetyltransferase [Arachnia sp.]HMR12157.1 NeuD/PglB/VioB family sugar acetyltransferase [Arachnia sp.]
MGSRVVVVGASGFGRECLDVLDAMAAAGEEVEVVGVVDDAPSAVNLERLDARGVAYLGTIASWRAGGDSTARFVLGIGSPRVRELLVGALEGAGLRAFAAVHPSATLGARCELAEGVVVCAGAVVSTNVRLGRHVHVNPNATIGHDAVLEEFVSVNPAAVISGEVLVGRGALVGAAATVLQNLTVGAGALVGAAALVTRDVPAGVVVKGVPGRWTEVGDAAGG